MCVHIYICVCACCVCVGRGGDTREVKENMSNALILN